MDDVAHASARGSIVGRCFFGPNLYPSFPLNVTRDCGVKVLLYFLHCRRCGESLFPLAPLRRCVYPMMSKFSLDRDSFKPRQFGLVRLSRMVGVVAITLLPVVHAKAYRG